MRTALRVGAIVLVILAVAASAALLIYRDELLARVADALTRGLTEQLGTPVEVERVALDLVPLTVIVEGLTVRSPSPELRVVPLSIERIEARPSLISLLTQTPVIRWLRVDRPRIDVVTSASGASNLPQPRARSADAPQAEPALLIRRVDVRNADVTVRTATLSASFAGVNATVLPDLVTLHIDSTVSAEHATVSVGPREIPLGAARAHVVIDRQLITVNSLSVNGQALSADARGTIGLEEPRAVDVVVSGAIELQSLVAALAPGQRMAGRVSTTIRAKGALASPTVSAEIDAQQLVYADRPIGDASARVEFQGRRASVTNVTARVFGGSAQGRGTLDLETTPPTWSAVADLSRIEAARGLPLTAPWAAILSRYHASGPVELAGRGLLVAELAGRGQLTLAKRAQAHDRPAADSSGADRIAALIDLIESGEIPWTVGQHTLTISGGSLATATGRILVNGTLDGSQHAALEVDVQDQDVAAVIQALDSPLAVAGTASFRGQVNGPLSSPVVEGRAAIRQLALREHPAGDLASTLRYGDRVLSLRETVWERDGARYDTVGTLSWTGESVPGFDLTASLRKARIQDILPIAFQPLPISAETDGTLTFRGTPADFLLAADLTLANGSLWGQEFDQGSVRMTLDRDRIAFPSALIRRGESEIRGRGTIHFHDGFDAVFEAPQLHLQTLNLFALNQLPLSGTATVELSMSGTFSQPTIHGTATIAYLEAAGQPLGGGRVTLDVADHRLVLDAALDDQHAQLAAALRWEPDFPVSATLTLEDSSLVPLVRPWLPAAIADITATVSGRIGLNGPLLKPMAWRVDARLTRLSADVGEYVVDSENDLVVTVDRGRVTVDAARLRGTDTTLTVSGRVDLFSGYDLVIVGEADLRLTRLFVPTVTSGSGKTYLVLRITDRWDSPKIQGGVTIQSARIRSRAFQQAITVDTVGLFFNERQVVLESLEGAVGNGRISASGQIQLTGFRPTRFGLLIDVTDVQFPLMEALTPTFSGQVVLSGTPETQSLRGELRIVRALYTTRIDVQDWVLDLRRRAEAPPPPPEALALGQAMELNIHFTGRDDVAIKNNLADVALELDLFLKGTVDRPYVIGRIETREGTLTFRNNTFRVRSATVDFVDPTRFRPVLDLNATTKVQQYEVTLRLAGTIERFDLDLASDPSLSETDILALLTVGRTTEQVARSGQSVGRDEAVSLAMQQLLEEGVQRLPGVDLLVDSFQIDPHYDPALNTSAPELSVGKQLFDERLVLRYSTTLDTTTARQGVRVEYELARNLFLIGEQDSIRGFGGDIRFRFEFR